MALTDGEIQLVKMYMGYGGMTVLALPYLNTAPVFEDVVQNNLNPATEDFVRNTILVNLAAIDAALSPTGSVAKRMGVSQLVGDVIFDTSPGRNPVDMYGQLRETWIDRLSEIIRVPRAHAPRAMGCGEVY